MEIIVQGNLEKIKQTKEFRCLQCGCVFKANKKRVSIRRLTV